MLAAIKQMISLTALCIPSQPRPANLIMASSSFPQEKSVAVLIPLPWLPGHATWETNSCENIVKTSLNDFILDFAGDDDDVIHLFSEVPGDLMIF